MRKTHYFTMWVSLRSITITKGYNPVYIKNHRRTKYSLYSRSVVKCLKRGAKSIQLN